MPYPNEHAARLIRPELFEKESFRRKEISDGIDIIFGRIKGQDKLTPQAYRFNKKKFTAEEAKAWLKKEGLKYILFEEALKEVKAFKKRIVLAELEAFQKFDIMSHIDKETLAKIRERDSHPFFKAYAIAHEGYSTPRVIGEGQQKIFWPREAIQSIAKAVKKGIKFFKGHNEDNSIEGRPYLGRIVASTEKEINGKLHSIVIGYFNPRNRSEVKKYNICSMEAVWNLVKQGAQLVGESMHKLSGIALGNSKEESPAWSGAKELAMVQAFETIKEKEEEVVEMPEELKFADVKQWVKDHVVHPSQLYTLDEIQKDHKFMDEFKKMEDKVIELDDALKKITKLEEENKSIKLTQQKTTLNDRLTTLGTDQKWTDKQKAFIMNNVDLLTDYSDEALSKYVEMQKALYQKNAPVFGIDTEISLTDGKQHSGDSKDFTKAENNELLDSDYEE